MPNRAREAVAPLYLFACLLFGGSAQGVWGNMLLQLAGLAIIAWAALSRDQRPLARPARQLLLLAGLAIALIVIQLVPLPAGIWPKLGGRNEIASGFATLGLPLPALPISLTPYKSLDTLLALIPPLAIFCAMVRLKAYRPAWMVAALLAGLILGVLVGALQVSSADPLTSPWYLYPDTNFGVAVGLFANANHMGILLVVALPFLAALAASGRGVGLQRYTGLVAWVAGTGLVVLVGIALNGSLAAYGLALPVLLASGLILLPRRSRWRWWAGGASALLLASAIVVIATRPVGGALLHIAGSTSVESRAEMFRTTARAIGDFMPFGSGLGSFRDVYHLYETASEVTPTYVVHAHNDYLELALELGVPGILLILLFFIWWFGAVWRVWYSAEAGPYARAASIASAALLAHSLVDFPLRTAAIAGCMGMFLALLADRGVVQAAQEPSDLRPTRHFVLR